VFVCLYLWVCASLSLSLPLSLSLSLFLSLSLSRSLSLSLALSLSRARALSLSVHIQIHMFVHIRPLQPKTQQQKHKQGAHSAFPTENEAAALKKKSTGMARTALPPASEAAKLKEGLRRSSVIARHLKTKEDKLKSLHTSLVSTNPHPPSPPPPPPPSLGPPLPSYLEPPQFFRQTTTSPSPTPAAPPSFPTPLQASTAHPTFTVQTYAAPALATSPTYATAPLYSNPPSVAAPTVTQPQLGYPIFGTRAYGASGGSGMATTAAAVGGVEGAAKLLEAQKVLDKLQEPMPQLGTCFFWCFFFHG